MFLIYSVWTTLVLIDKKKGKSSDSNLKENDNGIMGRNGVVSDRGREPGSLWEASFGAEMS